MGEHAAFLHEGGQSDPAGKAAAREPALDAKYAREPIAGGREIWGSPKKLASPELRIEKDTIGGILRYGPGPGPDRACGDGLQAPTAAARQDPRFAIGAELSAQDHSARGWHRTHL